jgi:hypothetical protein
MRKLRGHGIACAVIVLFAVHGRAQDTAATPGSVPPQSVLPDGGPTADRIVQAVWTSQAVDFYYHSFSTFYSCIGLQQKMKGILRELGADPSSRVRVTGCEAGSQIASMPIVRIVLNAPAEATPETLAELEKTRSQRELAARVRNDRANGIPAFDAQFPAHWKPISFSRRSLDIEPEDCELLEQLQRSLFPRMGVRVKNSRLRCTPGQGLQSRPLLEVEALVPLPAADADARTQGGAPSQRREKN